MSYVECIEDSLASSQNPLKGFIPPRRIPPEDRALYKAMNIFVQEQKEEMQDSIKQMEVLQTWKLDENDSQGEEPEENEKQNDVNETEQILEEETQQLNKNEEDTYWHRPCKVCPCKVNRIASLEDNFGNKMQSDFSWIVPIEVMLGSLNHAEVQLCSISNVPEKRREANEDAYTPKHISIGPLHRGANRHLQLMEEPKWNYMRRFLDRQTQIRAQNRRPEIRLRECGIDILKLEKVICASYGGSNNNICEETESHELAKIMMVDGCFLLELLLKLIIYMNGQCFDDDSIFISDDKLLYVLNNVTMLENQIPFVVLKKLFRKVFPDGSEIKDDHRVANIVRKAFGYPLASSSGCAHILHLMHLSTVEQNQHHEGKKAKLELFCCATMLRSSGVIIRAKLNSTNQNQHKLLDIFDFDISFSDSGELDIPTLYIKETTEVKWRNLIAWEQSKFWIRCKYTSYALFFNGLICCEHDIELLQKKGVIVNELNKSNEDLMILFQTIAKAAEEMDLSYSEICARLNVYDYKGMKVTKVLQKLPIRAWHQCRRVFEILMYYGRNWYNILIRDHIPNVWKFIGILAAAILLVLTIMQTYYSSRSG